MTTYFLQTLVDISDNGPLNRSFPFTSKCGQLIHDKESLQIAKNQQQNFNTLIQTLQIRANISWQNPPVCGEIITANTQYGSKYSGKHKSWGFVFQTEQSSVYQGNHGPVDLLHQDLNYIPIVNFCKETTTFPKNIFITEDSEYRNVFVMELASETAVVDILQHYSS